ncbi:MAG: hypothetical protein A2987_02985 [Omnitrophica bacterium RIFCSPLOWO2_01_FULL_45_10]|nr:MAG: hypothetical protein A2987_02985 [Omnitrophica bacterium RIFCSPLOWO2_01_FULL_45_10]
MNLVWALAASVIVSIISLIGIFTLLFNEKLLSKILILLVSFGAGGLIGGAFLHLLPEAIEHVKEINLVFIYTVLGFVSFFALERFLHWRHCHKGVCDIHIFTYLNLFGDGIHNFIDGIIIGTSFVIDIKLGLVATTAVILHEIPQELGDFGILLYGGFSRSKALFYNFLSATTAIFGTLLGYYFAQHVRFFTGLLLPIAAGGFIYIASCDLIPEIHKQLAVKNATFSVLSFIAGILLMFWLKLIQG